MSANDGRFTCNDVVIAALRKSGIMGLGQSPYPSGSDVLDAQNDLSDMLAQWGAETWLTWNKLDIGFISDGRVNGYTVGQGGNFDLTLLSSPQPPLVPQPPPAPPAPGLSSTYRPDRIEAAYIRMLVGSGMPVDQPLSEIPAREQYARVALKQLVAFPKAYFYDASVPLGNLIIYPWPNASIYEIHIILKNQFNLVLPLNADLSMLPVAMRGAMKFNLARRLRQAYGKGLRPDPELNLLARKSLEILRSSQVQVPELRLPDMVLGRGARYNVYGDIFY